MPSGVELAAKPKPEANAPAWGRGDVEKFAENPHHRVEALNQFANVCTFVAGFALADLGGIEWNFPPYLGELYVTLMSFAAGCTAFNAVLGILLVVVHQRLRTWDEGNLPGQRGPPYVQQPGDQTRRQDQ